MSKENIYKVYHRSKDHQYIYRFNQENKTHMIQEVTRQAKDKDYPLDCYNATIISHKIKETKDTKYITSKASSLEGRLRRKQ